MQINLGVRRRTYVHRLVAEAFLPNPENKPVVNHMNSDPRDNRVENLEWATYSENLLHGWRENPKPHYMDRPVICHTGGEIIKEYPSAVKAANEMNVSASSIRSAIRRKGTCRGYSWVYA